MMLAQELPQVTIPEKYLSYNESLAKEYIEKAAYLGFAKAQLKMGSAYELCTLGCEFNPVLSIHYNALAARQGEPEAEMALSKWFLCGYEGLLQKNDEMAFVYAERAAQASLPTALFAMGYFYEIGVYVNANTDKALEWYRKAAKAGNDDAQGRISSIAQSGTLSRNEHEQVAISRIRSQYGSKRGGRPDRFKKKPGEHLPAVTDNAEPSAPYPLDDRPPSVAQAPPRSASVAPYPLDDGPPTNYSRPGLAPSSTTPQPGMRSNSAIPQAMRSSTAFSLRVDSPTASSPVSGGAMPGMRPPRASSAQGYRQAGGPSVEHPEQSSFPTNPSPMHSHDQRRPENLRLDVGYSAPVDGRNRLHKNSLQSRSPLPSSPAGGRQTFDRPGSSHRPASSTSRIGSVPPPVQSLQSRPQPHQQQRLDAALSPPPPSSSRMGRGPRSPSPGPGAPSRMGAGNAGFSHTNTFPQGRGRPYATDTDASSVSSSGTASQKPSPLPSPAHSPGQQGQAGKTTAGGKGPKTFEEMGIPQTKQDHDCVSLSIFGFAFISWRRSRVNVFLV